MRDILIGMDIMYGMDILNKSATLVDLDIFCEISTLLENKTFGSEKFL